MNKNKKCNKYISCRNFMQEPGGEKKECANERECEADDWSLMEKPPRSGTELTEEQVTEFFDLIKWFERNKTRA